MTKGFLPHSSDAELRSKMLNSYNGKTLSSTATWKSAPSTAVQSSLDWWYAEHACFSYRITGSYSFSSTQDGFEVLCCTETFSLTSTQAAVARKGTACSHVPRNHWGDRKSQDNWVAPELPQKASSQMEVRESPPPMGLSQLFSFQRFWLPQANQHSEKWSAGVVACSQLARASQLWWPCWSGEAHLFCQNFIVATQNDS